MRKINQTVSQTMENNAFLSEKDKSRIGADLAQSLGALSCLLASFLFLLIFPTQTIVAGFIQLLGVLIVGIPILRTAVKGFLQKEFSSAMEILVSIAMLLSVLNRETVVALLIPLLLTVVHFIEEKSVMSSRDAINSLQKLQSSTALRVKDGQDEQVDASELKKDDVIRVLPGMALPIDGVVLKGTSSINQQSLTGESMPCEVEPDSPVYAGTINLDSELMVRVEKPYRDTSFQKIVNLLEESQQGATTESRLMDSFLKYYIPVALIIATLVWLFTRQIDRAVAILVVSCPCGHMLVNSAPMIAMLSVAGRRGVWIRSVSFIERMSQVSKVFFDKTGTLTTGTLVVEKSIPFEGHSQEELVSLAKTVAMHSHHPLSQAVSRLDGAELEDYVITEQSGRGICGVKGSHTILFGNARWLREQGLELAESVEEGLSASYVVYDGQPIGVICFSDTTRENVSEVVQSLHNSGVHEVAVLTGDKRAIAQRLQTQCGLDAAYSELLPAEKKALIEKACMDDCVAFIGDGINDVPALTAADISIAMGGVGADAAIQSADVTLMNENLSNIPFALSLATKTNRIIHENLLIAFSTSLVMIVLAAMGVVATLPGALLHNIGAFFVLLNSSRLFYTPESSEPEPESTPTPAES